MKKLCKILLLCATIGLACQPNQMLNASHPEEKFDKENVAKGAITSSDAKLIQEIIELCKIDKKILKAKLDAIENDKEQKRMALLVECALKIKDAIEKPSMRMIYKILIGSGLFVGGAITCLVGLYLWIFLFPDE